MTGKYEQGAWFNGKLYARRCDVSFDGDWLVYLAMGGGGNDVERRLASCRG